MVSTRCVYNLKNNHCELSDSNSARFYRSKVVTRWYEEGGVLLLGYEMYRQLASRKQRKRKRKKTPKQNEPIDVEEEDRLLTLATGLLIVYLQ